MRRDGRDLPRVVGLDAADRDERVAALRERVGGEVLELAHLVAAVGEAGVAVLALGPDLDLAAEVLGEALEPVDRGGAEGERDAGEVGEGGHAGRYAGRRMIVHEVDAQRSSGFTAGSPGKRSSSGWMLSTQASWR